MPSPTSAAVHVDQLLTNVSIGYTNPKYIADQIFPTITVTRQSNIVPSYDQSHWFRDAAVLRAPGTKSRRGGFKVTKSDTYFCPRYSFGFEIPDELRDNADEPFNMDRDATNFVTEKGFLRREVGFAADFFTTGIWGTSGSTDKVGAVDFAKWSDYAASQPLVDIESWKDDMEAAIGREGNKLVLGKQVWVSLKWHPDLIDTIKFTQRGMMTTDLFAALTELQSIMIGRAIRVSSAEGVAEASATYVRIWGKNGLLAYVPDAPSLMTPAAGYTFVWARVANALQYIKRMRDEEAEVDIVEMNSYFDQKKTANFAGMFISAAVA